MSKAKVRNVPVSEVKYIESQKERKEAPARNFLLPEERKFPYRNKDGTINCNLLRAAIVRAAQHGYASVEKKARELYERHCKKDKEETEKSLTEFKLSAADILRSSILTGLHPVELFKSLNYSSDEILELII